MTVLPLTSILVVDDDPDARSLVKRVLRLGGYTVRTCASGSDALERAPVMRPDLIIMDIMMPGLDGPGTLTRLRAMPETADIPVIFLSASIASEETQSYQALGAAAVLRKPFQPLQLCERIDAIWRECHGGKGP